MIDDDRLDAVLESVGHHLAVAPDSGDDLSPDLASAGWAGRRHPGQRLLVAALAVVVVAGAVLAIAPARRTVGGWFGVGRTEFRVDVDLALPADRLPGFVAGGEPIAPSQAAARVGVPVDGLDHCPLGAPVAWLAVPEGGAAAVWDDGGTTLWLLPAGELQEILFTKTVAMAAQVRPLPDLGDGGVAVEGDHVLTTPYRSVAAGSAVLWTTGGLSFRLESTDAGNAGDAERDLAALASAIDGVLADARD
ncbi:hypothetical protein [Desertimonas flava]|uniref:hypothetical protein n=1 Tax=Desertimonas flava TaxID=2064846 RepID=UPI000E3409DC|nr:hypothetical protein [Desertimonas flava]